MYKIFSVLFFLICVFNLNAQNKPNIILLMADDMGWGDVGFNGNQIIKTPYLDRMASEGIKFNRFYAASAECSPTRASVLTGRNPFRTGVFLANSGILRSEEVTLSELLKKEGYLTGHFGKWHLGSLTTEEKDANRGEPGNFKTFNPPKIHGYDYAFVTEAKVPTWDPMKRPKNRFKRAGWDYLREDEEFVDYGTSYWDIDGKKVTDNLDGDDSRVIMDRVIPFIQKSTGENKPFFAVVWFHAPHMPTVAGPKYADMYKGMNSLMRNYAGCITAMDDQIGRLRSFLKEKGLESNTMIWFNSDNGPENGNPGTTGGFKGRKRSLHEGGVRVPGLLFWPDRISKGFETDAPVVTSDFLPTIADVLKIDQMNIPYELDGISLLPLIEGKFEDRKKFIGFSYPGQNSLVYKQYKLYFGNGSFQLFDLLNDPYEKNDIKDQKLDVLRELKAYLRKFDASCYSSFIGTEYGSSSFEKLEQKWMDPLFF